MNPILTPDVIIRGAGRGWKETLARPKKYTVRYALSRFLMLRGAHNHAYNVYAAGWSLLWGDRDIRSITLSDLREWKVKRLRNAAPGTVHIQLALLSGAIQQAQEDGVTLQNPVHQLGWDSASSQRQRFFTVSEEAVIQSVAPADLSEYSRYAVLTGLRIGEQLAIQWSDRQGAALWVRPQKTNKGRWIPLHREAAEIMDRRQHLALPFPSTYPRVYQAFRRTLLAANINGASWHTHRHTFASRLVQAGVSIYLVSKLLGHSNVSMTMRYSHLAMDDLEAAIGCLK